MYIERAIDIETNQISSGRHDFTISCNGSKLSRLHMKEISNKILSSLFYIELESTSMLTLSSRMSVNILCRIPSGKPLLNLISTLLRSGIKFVYTDKAFCRVLDYSIPGIDEEFTLKLRANFQSLNDMIDIQLHDRNDYGYSISHCPYRVHDILHDQRSAVRVEYPNLLQEKSLDKGRCDDLEHIISLLNL